MKALNGLVSQAGFPLGVRKTRITTGMSPIVDDQINNLLEFKNGFYCFEKALHVFPCCESEYITVEQWNEDSLWKANFGNLSDKYYFFAEDIFGNQFCYDKLGQIGFFDAETGNVNRMASGIEEWATLILGDTNFWTGYSLAREWQDNNGHLNPDQRLLPKIPFVLGGEFNIANLYCLESVKGMRFRGEIALQLRNLKPGAKVCFKIIDR